MSTITTIHHRQIDDDYIPPPSYENHYDSEELVPATYTPQTSAGSNGTSNNSSIYSGSNGNGTNHSDFTHLPLPPAEQPRQSKKLIWDFARLWLINLLNLGTLVTIIVLLITRCYLIDYNNGSGGSSTDGEVVLPPFYHYLPLIIPFSYILSLLCWLLVTLSANLLAATDPWAKDFIQSHDWGQRHCLLLLLYGIFIISSSLFGILSSLLLSSSSSLSPEQYSNIKDELIIYWSLLLVTGVVSISVLLFVQNGRKLWWHCFIIQILGAIPALGYVIFVILPQLYKQSKKYNDNNNNNATSPSSSSSSSSSAHDSYGQQGYDNSNNDNNDDDANVIINNTMLESSPTSSSPSQSIMATSSASISSLPMINSPKRTPKTQTLSQSEYNLEGE